MDSVIDLGHRVAVTTQVFKPIIRAVMGTYDPKAIVLQASLPCLSQSSGRHQMLRLQPFACRSFVKAYYIT
jgi:hypothetical protein